MNSGRFLAKSIIHGLIDLGGAPYRKRKRLCGKLIILTYHSFCSEWPSGLFNSLPIDRFERQLYFLRENFKLVSLQQGLDCLKKGQVEEKPYLAITIDDGFRDNYTYAWPVLKRIGVPATIFLATDFIDYGRPPWPTQVIEILERTDLSITEVPFRANLKTRSDRMIVARKIKRDWGSLPPLERFERLDELRNHLRVDKDTRYPGLNWNQVREMQKGGLTFGSHTVYHSILPMVDHAVLIKEIQYSKLRIEEELQEPCELFAYPDGAHNVLSRKELSSSGYLAAVTQDFGLNRGVEAILQLKRLEVPFHDPLPSFRVRVSFSLSNGECNK